MTTTKRHPNFTDTDTDLIAGAETRPREYQFTAAMVWRRRTQHGPAGPGLLRRLVSTVLLPALLAPGLVFLASGCSKLKEIEATGKEAQENRIELEKARTTIKTLQTNLRAREDEVTLLRTELEAVRKEHEVNVKRGAEREVEFEQFRSTTGQEQKEGEEARIFGEIILLYRQGQLNAALTRSRQFLDNYPRSPLRSDTQAAIGEIMADLNRRETTAATGATDPVAPVWFEEPTRTRSTQVSRERNLVNHVRTGMAVTSSEIAPLLKNKTPDQVIGMFGKPNRVFPGGSEWGYLNRGINTLRGDRDTLIISFNNGVVSAVRVGYSGARVAP